MVSAVPPAAARAARGRRRRRRRQASRPARPPARPPSAAQRPRRRGPRRGSSAAPGTALAPRRPAPAPGGRGRRRARRRAARAPRARRARARRRAHPQRRPPARACKGATILAAWSDVRSEKLPKRRRRRRRSSARAAARAAAAAADDEFEGSGDVRQERSDASLVRRRRVARERGAVIAERDAARKAARGDDKPGNKRPIGRLTKARKAVEDALDEALVGLSRSYYLCETDPSMKEAPERTADEVAASFVGAKRDATRAGRRPEKTRGRASSRIPQNKFSTRAVGCSRPLPFLSSLFFFLFSSFSPPPPPFSSFPRVLKNCRV